MSRDDSSDFQMLIHGNWIRMECLERAISRDAGKSKTPSEIIDEARVFEAYVTNRPRVKLLRLIKGKNKNGRG